jgi:serine-type D-Ala-D-Ala carboxypeptidase
MDTTSIKQAFFSGKGSIFPAATIEIRHEGGRLGGGFTGWLDPEDNLRPAYFDTLFDLASVSKLFVTTAFMTLVEEGKADLDQPVCSILPDFSGLRPTAPYENPLMPGEMVPSEWANERIDASKVTFRNLLAHNSGLPAWRPLFKEADPAAALRMAVHTDFFYPTGARVVYSDIGLILLGMAVEKLSGTRLDEVVYQRVTRPLRLHSTRYLPIGEGPYDPANIAPTEICPWRQRRIVAEVHDENAARLGGIAGHAGLFSTADDLVWFGQMFLDRGAPLLKPETVTEMTRLQAQDGTVRRGLGFALWSPDPENSGNPFSQNAFGHTGFTGTSLWIDPERQLVVALLTNRVYYGRNPAGILSYRIKIHRAVVEVIK